MKLKSYNILFRIFSFLSDKTNGASFFVKYKLLLGTVILGLASSSAKAQNKTVASDTITPSRPIPANVTCYMPASESIKLPPVSIEVKGNIKEESREPLIGVVVSIKSRPQTGTTTDVDGNFTLNVKDDDILVFAFIGFKNQEVPVSEFINGRVTVTLLEDVMILCYDPVVTRASYNDDIYTRSPKKITKLAYNEVDTNPVSQVGSLVDFEAWVQSKIKYSEQMQKDKVQGQVILSFAIDKKGKLVNKKVIAKLSKEADQEALRALSLSQNWTPGMYGNEPIKTTMTITVHFKAQ